MADGYIDYDGIQSLIEENDELKKELACWSKMLEMYGINDERMSAALSFAFADGDVSDTQNYLENMLSLSEDDFKWFKETHGIAFKA